MNKFIKNNTIETEINVDSLWLIPQRDKTGKHKNIYHGNFIPQIPNQLIRRYTKEQDVILEPFAGSGTTLFECENLNRKYIGFDINSQMINYIKDTMGQNLYTDKYYIQHCNSLDEKEIDKNIKNAYNNLKSNNVQFILMHPPYMDIIKFTDHKNDLSNINNLKDFLDKFKIICDIFLKYLEINKYFAIVIGDVYKNSEVIPLSFYCMYMIKKNFKTKLKGIIVKNIEGNRGKLGQAGIWKYRALKSDYFLFKHEYIFVFKKVK
jgi:16S rRNA G966 N2-methylase RsmD